MSTVAEFLLQLIRKEPIGCGSLVLTCLSVLLARRQVRLAEERNRLMARQMDNHRAQIIAPHLIHWNQFLAETIVDLKPNLRELMNQAEHTATALGELLDQYDSRKEEPLHVRHLYHELCEKMYRAFSVELGWQTPENLYERIGWLRQLEADAEDAPATWAHLDPVAEFRRVPQTQLERELIRSSEYREELRAFLSRLDPDRRIRLCEEARELLARYSSGFERARPGIEAAMSKVGRFIATNPICLSDYDSGRELKQRSERTLATLGLLHKLSLDDLQSALMTAEMYGVSRVVYAGVVLDIVIHLPLWSPFYSSD